MISTNASGPGPIYNMDARLFVADSPRFHCAFMDPPDNIGLSYAGYNDKLPQEAYYGWLESLLFSALQRCNIVWLSYYYKHDLRISALVDGLLRNHYGSWSWQKIIWRYTFGQYQDTKIGNGYRPILCLCAHGTSLYLDTIREESERMRLGDPRAAGLRVPDDVWEIPRVTGNSGERRSWHPTQHPEYLMRRIITLSVAKDQRFVDLFGGTGTSLRASRGLGLDVRIVEKDPSYCSKIATEFLL